VADSLMDDCEPLPSKTGDSDKPGRQSRDKAEESHALTNASSIKYGTLGSRGHGTPVRMQVPAVTPNLRGALVCDADGSP